jgi:hypothetical protein
MKINKQKQEQVVSMVEIRKSIPRLGTKKLYGQNQLMKIGRDKF